MTGFAAGGRDETAALGAIVTAGDDGPTVERAVVEAGGFAGKAAVTAMGAGLAGATIVATSGVAFAGVAAAGNDATAGLVCTGVAVGGDVIVPRTDKHKTRISMIPMARTKLISTSLLIVLAW